MGMEDFRVCGYGDMVIVWVFLWVWDGYGD